MNEVVKTPAVELAPVNPTVTATPAPKEGQAVQVEADVDAGPAGQ